MYHESIRRSSDRISTFDSPKNDHSLRWPKPRLCKACPSSTSPPPLDVTSRQRPQSFRQRDGRAGLPPARAVLHPDRALGPRAGGPWVLLTDKPPTTWSPMPTGCACGPNRASDPSSVWTGTGPTAWTDPGWCCPWPPYWVLAYSTRGEEAHLRGLNPERVRRPSLEPAVTQDWLLTVFQLG